MRSAQPAFSVPLADDKPIEQMAKRDELLRGTHGQDS